LQALPQQPPSLPRNLVSVGLSPGLEATLFASDARRDFLGERLGLPLLTVPLWQQVERILAIVVVIIGLKGNRFFEEGPDMRLLPALRTGDTLEHDVPVRAFSLQARG